MKRDPQEPDERLGKYRHDPAAESWLLALNTQLHGLTLPDVASPGAGRLPLIYIVGAPRSGSTLLSQVLSRHLQVGYINNLIARFWARPSVGIRLSQIVLGDRAAEHITFASEHGVSAGAAGPHEFGYFWRHWLRLDEQPTHHLDTAARAALDHDGLRHALENEILGTFALPVVFKNLICGFQAATLAAIHPQTVFVHIQRDRAANARSILSARLKRHGRYDAWWSLKPSTFDDIRALRSPVAQVLRQIDDTTRELSNEISGSGAVAVDVRYEELCGHPADVINHVVGAMRGAGAAVATRPHVPAAFEQSPGPPLPPELADELSERLSASQ
jgi:LPS sulfotransferase NodH